MLHGGWHVCAARAESACDPGELEYSYIPKDLTEQAYSICTAITCDLAVAQCIFAVHLQEDFEMAVAKVMKKDSDANMSLRKLFK